MPKRYSQAKIQRSSTLTTSIISMLAAGAKAEQFDLGIPDFIRAAGERLSGQQRAAPGAD